MWGKVGLVLASFLVMGAAGTEYGIGRQSMVKVTFPLDGAQCTGTVALRPDLILTAEHCITTEFLKEEILIDTGPVIIDGNPMTTYTVVQRDGRDHVFIKVEAAPPGKRVASIAKTFPSYGDVLYFWGHPNGMPDMLRIGHYMGMAHDNWALFAMNTAPGDSGGAYFNHQGEIVTINWGYSTVVQTASIGIPLGFTPQQYQELRHGQ